MCSMQILLVISLVVQLTYSWDIAVSVGDRIDFHNADGTKTDTVYFESQNITALVYDEVHNMLLYVDKQSDRDNICGYNMTSVEYKCYLDRSGGNVRSLAFDPVSEKLFFTDTKERSINWFSFKPGFKNNDYGNLFIKFKGAIPTDIAVDSCRGYIYWINTNLTRSTIERARFRGSEREIVVTSTYQLDLHSLAIDQKSQKLFFFMPLSNSLVTFYSADLNGRNLKSLHTFTYQGETLLFNHPNTIAVSKNAVISMVAWCLPCLPRYVWTLSPSTTIPFTINTQKVVGIATNYKMSDQVQGISDCSHVTRNYNIDESLKVAKEYESSFCVHGIKVRGQSLCECYTGYTGVRCEESFCNNYCLEGACSFTEEGLPVCRCGVGFTGYRCEVNVCYDYCLNNGSCSLNEEDEPSCECLEGYEGGRCEETINKAGALTYN
ncbi:hypothetical protein PYW07_003490 [Mythimna separata]|uniref:Protein cueball n=1 Tax=Mythimna separata TaxID=271217 RepID=A0AAD7YJT2_MYTSE|nr:hypothetical protein PYW07_003490 [Mythimna separata]